jgi:ABC-2 type transport system ATP-binding protein
MAEAVPIVRVENVSKRFIIQKSKSLKERVVNAGRSAKFKEDFWALRDIDMEITAGTSIGLIGPNGSGKSTMLKAIGGIIQPTTGTITRRGRLAALLELGAGFHPDLTGRENVYLNASILGLSRKQTDSFFDQIVDFSGIEQFIDTQVKFYSSGMYVRLAFAVAIHVDPDLLLVDEVLAVGDEAFQRKCLDKIRDFQAEGRTIILVTHSLNQVTELCSRAVLLNQGRVLYDGEPRTAVKDFRDVLEERRIDEAVAHGEDPEADGSIPSTVVFAKGKRPGDPVLPGDDLVVEVTFAHPTGIDGWIGAIQIDTVQGLPVYGTATNRMSTEPGRLTDPRTIQFVLKNVQFGTGKYFVNSSLLSHQKKHLADAPQAASFDVPYFPLANGVIYAEPEISEVA